MRGREGRTAWVGGDCGHLHPIPPPKGQVLDSADAKQDRSLSGRALTLTTFLSSSTLSFSVPHDDRRLTSHLPVQLDDRAGATALQDGSTSSDEGEAGDNRFGERSILSGAVRGEIERTGLKGGVNGDPIPSTHPGSWLLFWRGDREESASLAGALILVSPNQTS